MANFGGCHLFLHATTVFVGTIQALEYSPHAMQVVAEYSADATPASPARKFVYAEYIDEPVMMLSTSGATTTPYYYHQNSLYSVAAISDATGTVVERYAYSAYGKPLFLDAAANLLDPQATTVGNPYLFTGRRLDEETGLYYYRARMYDAELGRFVGRGPIGYEGNTGHLYLYVTDNPVCHTDSSGMKTEASDKMPPDKPIGGWNLANIATCYELCVNSHKTNIACAECVEDCYNKHKSICLKQKAMNVRVACNLAAHEGLKAFSGVCAYYPSSAKVCPPKGRKACCHVNLGGRRGTKSLTIDCDLPKTAPQCCKEQFEDRVFAKMPVIFSVEGACK